MSSSDLRNCCEFFFNFLVLILIPTAAWYGWEYAVDQSPHYSVSIHSVSGLDPATDLGHRHPLNPEFNLTMRVASHRFFAHRCFHPGMYVEVSYRGVDLAASMTATHEICAGPRKHVDFATVARGDGVVLPGPVLYGLAGDMRGRWQAFDVTIRGLGNMAWHANGVRVPTT